MNQHPLPTKAKIVVWSMIVIGVISLISLLPASIFCIFVELTENYILLEEFSPFAYALPILLMPSAFLISPVVLTGQACELSTLLPYLPFSILYIFFGFLLLKRVKWALLSTIIFLIIGIFFVSHQIFYKMILSSPTVFTINSIFVNPGLYISGIFILFLILDKNNYWKACEK